MSATWRRRLESCRVPRTVFLNELRATPDERSRYFLLPTIADLELAQAVLGIVGQLLYVSPDFCPTRGSVPYRFSFDPAPTKHKGLVQMKRQLFLNHEHGVTAADLAAALGMSRRKVWPYLNDLGTTSDTKAKYRLPDLT